MRAVLADPPAPAYLADVADPAPQPGAEVVQVLAAALTNLDVANAEGRHYLAPAIRPFGVGREALVRDADGRRVWCNAVSLVAPYGSMAERTLMLAGRGLPVPDGVPDALAAALGNAGLAAWLPLSWRARLQSGETVLILGATGTTGLLAVAAARRLGAGRIIAAGRRPQALEQAQALGADAVVRLDDPDFLAALEPAAAGGVDVVIDYLNGPPAEAALQVMAEGGRMVQVGSALAPALLLHAQTARRLCLDVLGFAYYHAPLQLQVQAYAQLCSLSAQGLLPIAYEIARLEDFARAGPQSTHAARRRFVFVP
jgi:NADPH:quinone reductase-like Zn-dependent oxidoreductase